MRPLTSPCAILCGCGVLMKTHTRGLLLALQTEAGLTCRHDRHLSSDDAFHSQAEQSSSHQAAGEGQILQTQTGSQWADDTQKAGGGAELHRRTFGAWSRYCFPADSWLSNRNMLSWRT